MFVFTVPPFYNFVVFGLVYILFYSPRFEFGAFCLAQQIKLQMLCVSKIYLFIYSFAQQNIRNTFCPALFRRQMQRFNFITFTAQCNYHFFSTTQIVKLSA